ncbi:MAG: ferrous iron transport protein B [Actinomycetota bacterium]|nr:ferrous iron transport protein B [Actinomycetota bacterium]MCL6092592.1 ferrous iron transport protein B [Actinomycetota bacterium]MDA8166884.1 ferrous iron transport protein B [Actinomycetota bacterium]
MQFSCHSAIHKLRGETDLTIALAGNPNVGKSSIFNSLTGMGVDTANYPGKTVEINMAVTSQNGTRIGIIDLPGTYALGAVSEDQWVARQGVLDGNPDAVIMVVDATNLSRNLYMVLQFLELGYPLVIALNVLDLLRRQGRDIDIDRLSAHLGAPVIPTVANRGEGLDELVLAAERVARTRKKPEPPNLTFGRDVERVIGELTAAIAVSGVEEPYGLPHRAMALLLLENDPEFVEIAASMQGWQRLLELAAKLRQRISEEHGQPSGSRVAGERHLLAAAIAEEVESTSAAQPQQNLGERLWRYTTGPVSGVPILLAILAFIFVLMYFAGNNLANVLSDIWEVYVVPPLQSGLFAMIGDNAVSRSLMWIPQGFEAALTIGVPFVLVFYFVLAFLEDTGYLNSVAFLTDSVMHKFGLHGRAMIPIVAGAGCNVPAIIGTRVLTTRRERLLAGTLIALVPCSARTAVIFGAVAFYAGWQAALGLYLIVMVIWVLAGLGLNKIMPGESTGLVMEMFSFRRPHLKTMLKKTWFRFKAFVMMAAPIIAIGSLGLGALYQSGYLFDLVRPLSPVVETWMGLPPVAGLALVMGVLRKELALQLLVTLAIAMGAGAGVEHNLNLIMTNSQLFVFALVTAIYIPCAATVAVLGKELGWKGAAAISLFTVTLAVLAGGLVNQLFHVVG